MASGSLALLCPQCSSADPFQPFFAARARRSPRFVRSSLLTQRRWSPADAAQRLPLRRRALPPKAVAGDNEELVRFKESCTISDFLKFRMGDDGGGTGELQTAVVSYRKRFPWSIVQPFLQVDLVTTIHIADNEYFETLQKELQPYDCVLYEMVASKASLENRNKFNRLKVAKSRSKGFNITGFIQRQMARILSLDFQLDCLDYQGSKWYHADLDFETFEALQTERGESVFTFARDLTVRSTKAFVQPSSDPDIPDNLDPWRSKLLWVSRAFPMPLLGLFIIESVCAPLNDQVSKYPELGALSRLDIGTALKIFLARALTSELTQISTAIDDSTVIIGERNKAAVEALRRAIDGGNNRIAVLYGGGHMPDLGRRLSEEFDMVPTRVNWVTAWSIRDGHRDSHSLPFLRTLAQMSGWPLNRYQTLALLIFSSVLAVDLWFWELFVGTIADWASWATEAIYVYGGNIWFM